jgi:hypothetical protein
MLVTDMNIQIARDKHRLKSGYVCAMRFWSPKNSRWTEIPFTSIKNAKEFKVLMPEVRRQERKPFIVKYEGRIGWLMTCPKCLKPTLP